MGYHFADEYTEKLCLDMIRIGLIAGNKLEALPDAKIHLAPPGLQVYHASKVGRQIDIVSAERLYDFIEPALWRGPDGFEIGIGYSKKLNILVLWLQPDKELARSG